MADFNNTANQAERRKVLEEDKRAKTYMRQAEIDADLELGGGRFAKIITTTVTGSGPVSVPRLPSDNQSNQALMVGPEEPLGYDINAMDPVGEPHERAELRRKSWRRL